MAVVVVEFRLLYILRAGVEAHGETVGVALR